MTKDEKQPKIDASATEQKPELNISKGKVKKNKKKKKHNKSASSISSSSVASEAGASPPLVVDEPAKEKFYDAHESYHGLKGITDNPPAASCPASQAPAPPPAVPPAVVAPAGLAVPAITTTLLVAHSEHGLDPKIQPSPPSAGTISSSARAKKAPSTVTKPVTGPE